MRRVQLSKDLSVSGIALGFWRLSDWSFSESDLDHHISYALEQEITTFDHADIYGDYQCEEIFGNYLSKKSSLRSQIQLVTKCGIKLTSHQYPKRRINHYDTSKDHIIQSVERSLKKLRTEYIDLLLIHRPDPLMDPSEINEAFNQLFQQGKVLNFGVSNFSAPQFDLLNGNIEKDLITNQIEISPYYLDHIENGNLDHCLLNKISPMAWSPVAQGKISKPYTEKGKRIHDKLWEIADRRGMNQIDPLIYAWLYKHPAKIIPILGTGKQERIDAAVTGMKIKLEREEWYEVMIASKGQALP